MAMRTSSVRWLGRRLSTQRISSHSTVQSMVAVDHGAYNPLPIAVNHQQQRTMVMVTQKKAGTPSVSSSTASGEESRNQPQTTTKEDEPASAAAAAAAAPQSNGDPAPLTITESCWKRIHKLTAEKQDDSLFLRVFVDAGGCSGFQYQFELDSNLDDDDVIFAQQQQDGSTGARVVVDPSSLDFMRGATIDYVQEMIKSSFEVRENPQSESACGCGSSFALKNFASNPAMD